MLHPEEVRFGDRTTIERRGENSEGDAIFQEAMSVWDCGLVDRGKPFYWKDVAVQKIEGTHIPLWIIGRREDLQADSIAFAPETSSYEAVFNYQDVSRPYSVVRDGASPIHSTGIVLALGSAQVEPLSIANHTVSVHEYYGPHLRGHEQVNNILAVTREGLHIAAWDALTPIDHMVVLMRGLRGCSSLATQEEFGAYAIMDPFTQRDRDVLAGGQWPEFVSEG